jgi:hypothetical protein
MKYLDKIHSVTPDRKPDVNVISLYDAAKYHLFSRELFADLLVNIERGHVKVVGHDISEKKFNLSSILLSKKSFNSFLEKVIKKANGYSIPETAHIMSLKEEVLYHLVNHGFISCSKDPTHLRRGRIITHDAIVKFQATYISLTELTGIPIKSVERLKSIGAFPAIGGGVDGCRQVFYKREDISILWSLP